MRPGPSITFEDRRGQGPRARVGGKGSGSLDAIHLAAAQVFGDELTAVVTYDQRMREAGTLLGLPVVAPG